MTDERLRVLREDGTSYENIWAIGDAAIIKDGLLPATAQGIYSNITVAFSTDRK